MTDFEKVPRVSDDLEARFAEAREQVTKYYGRHWNITGQSAFDAAAAIAREVVAEKDAEIARLRSGLDTLGKTVGERAEVVGRLLVSSLTAPEQPRKVTDAQRERIAEMVAGFSPADSLAEAVNDICRVIESTDEPVAK
jgi:hypothetical protein